MENTLNKTRSSSSTTKRKGAPTSSNKGGSSAVSQGARLRTSTGGLSHKTKVNLHLSVSDADIVVRAAKSGKLRFANVLDAQIQPEEKIIPTEETIDIESLYPVIRLSKNFNLHIAAMRFLATKAKIERIEKLKNKTGKDIRIKANSSKQLKTYRLLLKSLIELEHGDKIKIK